MVLGCRYDVSTDTCREGEGFNGYISQVSLYNRELIFKDELTVLGNINPFYVFPDAVMTWGEFLLYPGVTRVYPSKADQTCPRGFSGFPSCTTPVVGLSSCSLAVGWERHPILKMVISAKRGCKIHQRLAVGVSIFG